MLVGPRQKQLRVLKEEPIPMKMWPDLSGIRPGRGHQFQLWTKSDAKWAHREHSQDHMNTWDLVLEYEQGSGLEQQGAMP